MLLSIFNSKRSFFLKILVSFAGIFICANFLLWLKVRWSDDSPFLCPVLDYFNEITLERFAVQPKKWKTVIVGSSATSFIPPFGYWPKGCFSLAQQGGTGRTGLEAILRTGARPEKVLIEVDFLMRAPNNKILDRTCSQTNLVIKKYLPIFREEFAPIVFLQSIFNPQINYNLKAEETDVWNKKMDEIGDRAKMYLAIEELTDKTIKEGMSEIRNIVDKMRENGSEVIFFTLPLHPILANDNKYKKWNVSLKNEFSDYKWVSFAPENFLTVDGIHPTPEAGNRMFKKLME